jgi:hypothetical protein
VVLAPVLNNPQLDYGEAWILFDDGTRTHTKLPSLNAHWQKNPTSRDDWSKLDISLRNDKCVP